MGQTTINRHPRGRESAINGLEGHPAGRDGRAASLNADLGRARSRWNSQAMRRNERNWLALRPFL